MMDLRTWIYANEIRTQYDPDISGGKYRIFQLADLFSSSRFENRLRNAKYHLFLRAKLCFSRKWPLRSGSLFASTQKMRRPRSQSPLQTGIGPLMLRRGNRAASLRGGVLDTNRELHSRYRRSTSPMTGFFFSWFGIRMLAHQLHQERTQRCSNKEAWKRLT